MNNKHRKICWFITKVFDELQTFTSILHLLHWRCRFPWSSLYFVLIFQYPYIYYTSTEGSPICQLRHLTKKPGTEYMYLSLSLSLYRNQCAWQSTWICSVLNVLWVLQRRWRTYRCVCVCVFVIPYPLPIYLTPPLINFLTHIQSNITNLPYIINLQISPITPLPVPLTILTNHYPIISSFFPILSLPLSFAIFFSHPPILSLLYSHWFHS